MREETGVEARVRRARSATSATATGAAAGGSARPSHFFLCDYVAGDTADHDHEVDEARWMPLERARDELSYPGEREMIERALSKHAGSDR